jgi:dTDP-4-dehydrorhamnose reductase
MSTLQVTMMKVLITGKGGQLSSELEQTLPKNVQLISLGIEELDVSDASAVMTAMKVYQPQVVINAAAYTAVDKAEQEPSVAYLVNEQGAANLANACKYVNAFLFHVSTDFVFDGTKTTPYKPEDTPNPLGVYGASKLAGDIRVSEILAGQALIVRTAWVYSSHGNNFVKTMLRLMADKPQLGVVYDQVGTPTWAKGLALWLWAMATKLTAESATSAPKLAGLDCNKTTIYHWTDAGVASWYDFAIAIQELALEKGVLTQAIPVTPIPASAYPTPAKRPAFSVIDKSSAEHTSGIATIHWRKQLSSMLDELQRQSNN